MKWTGVTKMYLIFIILQVSDGKDNEYIFLTGVNYIFFKLRKEVSVFQIFKYFSYMYMDWIYKYKAYVKLCTVKLLKAIWHIWTNMCNFINI